VIATAESVYATAAWPRHTAVANLHLALLLLGACLNGLAYDSLAALAFGPMVLAVGLAPVALWGLSIGAPRLLLAGYSRVFCVAWFMAGIAAAYARWLADPFQLGSDAFGFFQLASDPQSALGLAELRELTDGFGAVVLWRWVYDVAETLGIERLRFVGVGFNTLVVAITAAVALHACRLVYGPHLRREARLVLALSTCGIVWTFAAIHLRDAIILLVASLVTLAWVWFLRRGGPLRSGLLLVALVATAAAFAVLRTEFVAVPLIASVIGLAAMVAAPSTAVTPTRRWLAGLALVVGAAVASGLVPSGLETVGERADTYRSLVEDEASQSSLGAQLIVNQPPLVRAFLGSVYLLIFPIPVWSGLIGDSALHLFIALNALFFYAVIPLLGMASHDLVRDASSRSPGRLFVLGMTVAFVVGFALTSLESRHLGSLLLPILLLALVPDPDAPGHRRRYGRALAWMLATMVVVHLAWASAKWL
jgi:hypothetical protein